MAEQLQLTDFLKPNTKVYVVLLDSMEESETFVTVFANKTSAQKFCDAKNEALKDTMVTHYFREVSVNYDV